MDGHLSILKATFYKILFILVILCAGFLIKNAYATRIASPPIILEWDENTRIALNEYLNVLWEITNGRYTLDIVTTNPDGSATGEVGDMLLFNNSGTYYLEINVDGSTTWRGVALSDTP